MRLRTILYGLLLAPLAAAIGNPYGKYEKGKNYEDVLGVRDPANVGAQLLSPMHKLF